MTTNEFPVSTCFQKLLGDKFKYDEYLKFQERHTHCNHCYACDGYSRCNRPEHNKTFEEEHKCLDGLEALIRVIHYIRGSLQLEPWLSLSKVLADIGRLETERLANEKRRAEDNKRLAESVRDLKMLEEAQELREFFIKRGDPDFIIVDIDNKIKGFEICLEAL